MTTIITYTLLIPMLFMSPAATSDEKGVSFAKWDWITDTKVIGATWGFTWWNAPVQIDGVEIVPMIYGAANVCEPLHGNSTFVLVFNEPDLMEQANIPVDDLVDLWRRAELCYDNKQLVGPMVSDQHPEYLAQFRDAYIAKYGWPPRMIVSVHCYRIEPECETYVQSQIDLSRSWGISDGVWVTEFAFPYDTLAMEKFVNWLEDNPGVARYAWFTARDDTNGRYGSVTLFDVSGNITELGRTYRGLH